MQHKHEGSFDSVLPSTVAAIHAKAFAINPAAIGIVRFDNGLIVDVNEAWQKIFGYSHDEAVGHSATYLHLWPKEEDRSWYIEELQRQGSIRDRERRVLRKSGESFIALCSAELMALQGEDFIVSTWLDVSDRKRSEEEMREKDHLLSESQRAGHMGSWSREFGTDSIQWSDETYRIYGMNPASFRPRIQSFVDLILPGDRALIKDFMRACENGEHPKDVEFRIVRPDGTIRTLYGCGELECASDGTPLRLLGTIQDISERKQAENALSESKEQLAMALLSSGMGVWRMDLLNGRQQFDAQVCRCLGIDPARFTCTAEEFLGIVHPEDREKMKAALEKAVTGNAPLEVEYRVVWPDGGLHFIMARGKLVHDAAGRPQWVNGLAWDISEKKRSEEILRESEFRYRLIAENTADVIWVLDFGTQRFKYVSPSVKKMLGYTPEEVMAQPMNAALTPESAKQVQELFSFWLPKFLADPSIPGFVTTELDQPCKDGSIIHTEVTTNAIISERGEIEILGVSRDITERRRAENEKARLAAQLQQAQKMESVGRLAGGVAHDFNNMLGVILGHTEFALEQVGPAHPLHVDLEEIQKAGQRSADLTRQLLAFARKQTVTPRVLDLNKTVSGMAKMLQRLIGEDIKMEWKPGEDLWTVQIDASQIDQILANLAVNARDAIEGTGTLIIETNNITLTEAHCVAYQGYAPGDYVLLSVSDTGIGMDEDMLKHIFEPFFTTKEIGKGTGLGLATVYGIVEQNKGFIDVHSQPGKGARFEIFLPRFMGNGLRISEEFASGTASESRETILLVEDEPSILRLTTRMLEKLGYAVLAATSPPEAMRLAREHQGFINILMTDVVMPEMNGRDLAKKLLSIYPHLKCIFISGWTADIIAHQGVMEPGIYFLQKPFSREQLAAVLQSVKRKPDLPPTVQTVWVR